VSGQLGHKDPAITLRVYTHCCRMITDVAESIYWTTRNQTQPPRNQREDWPLAKTP
jgi:hypothetical protein